MRPGTDSFLPGQPSARHAPRFCLLASIRSGFRRSATLWRLGGVALWLTESGLTLGLALGPLLPLREKSLRTVAAPRPGRPPPRLLRRGCVPGSGGTGVHGVAGGRVGCVITGPVLQAGPAARPRWYSSRPGRSRRRSARSRCSGRPVPVGMANASGRTTPACRSTETASSISSWLFPHRSPPAAIMARRASAMPSSAAA
jgi:hypothetical protein